MDKKETRKINDYQREKYEEFEIMASRKLFEIYSPVINKLKNNETINILDIGGGNGNFALMVTSHFSEAQCSYYVLDNTRYNSWEENSENPNLNFVLGSAYELETMFANDFFDVIFVNRTLHHLVFDTWRETVKGYDTLFSQISNVLKDDGYLCITEETAESYVHEKAGSYIIYKLTTCKFKPIISLCKKLNGKSAGVGVCFLSDKSWRAIFANHNFVVENVTVGKKRKIKFYWRICLLLKEYFFDKGYILRKVRNHVVVEE